MEFDAHWLYRERRKGKVPVADVMSMPHDRWRGITERINHAVRVSMNPTEPSITQ
jgi:hypothetical protein